MLKGDLVTTPLPQVLRQLADSASSGCLHVLDARGEEGRVYLRGGHVYAVQVPGQRPLLGQHLVSSGALGPEMLAEALEAQRTELQGWKLGELLVHLGYVDAPVVEDFLAEQMRDQAGDLLRWPTGTWKFRVNERAREDVARPTTVEELLADCDERALQWDGFLEVLHSQEAVPVLSAAGSSDAEMAIDPQAWSLLCKVDGTRDIAELALECGFTLFEAGHVVHTLVRSGLLEVEEPVIVDEEESVGASVASRLAAAFAPADASSLTIPQQSDEPSPAEVAELLTHALREDRPASALAAPSDDEVDGSIDRLSAALSAMLGPTTDDALFAPRPRKETKPQPTAAEKEKAERDRRRRERDAAELAAAQAELEESRRVAWEGPFADDHEAEIVSLEDVRREAALRDEEETRVAEQARMQEESRALEQERAALDAERAQHEEDARAAEEDKLRRAEEAQLAEAARKAEAERVAEQARQEEQRQQEQARLAEEERLRAAEEARLVEARSKLDEERAALAEERAQLEDQVRQAQEDAEEARLAAEAEAARLAEEARLAAEEAEATRLAAEAEAARLAEERAQLEDQVRQAQEDAEEAEAVRLAADAAEAARVAEEARLAEEAAAENARLEAQLRQEAENAAERARVEAQLREEASAQAAAAAAAAAEQASLEEQQQVQAAAEAQARADIELEERTREATRRTEASSAFAELSAAALLLPEPEAAPVAAEPEPEPEPEEPERLRQAADTDMASLFRELSSLGMEDEPAPAAPPRTPPRPAGPPSAQAKKKKGLFGR